MINPVVATTNAGVLYIITEGHTHRVRSVLEFCELIKKISKVWCLLEEEISGIAKGAN